MESKVENKRKQGKPKGLPKTGGRQKGTVNKKSLILRERLEQFGCNFDEQLANAILTQNYAMIKALSDMLPYLQPRLKEIDQPKDTPESPESNADTSNLVALVSNDPK